MGAVYYIYVKTKKFRLRHAEKFAKVPIARKEQELNIGLTQSQKPSNDHAETPLHVVIFILFYFHFWISNAWNMYKIQNVKRAPSEKQVSLLPNLLSRPPSPPRRPHCPHFIQGLSFMPELCRVDRANPFQRMALGETATEL